MQALLNKKRMEKVVELLETGDYETRMRAIEILASVNLIQVKKALLKCLDDGVKGVSLKAAESLEIMGVTPEEKELIVKCREHWNENKKTLIKEEKSFLKDKK